MTERRATVLLVAMLALSTVTAAALGVTDATGTPGYGNRFLLWNLFLAWIPMAAAWGMARLRSVTGLVALGAVWLAFLPNAPYLLTDLVHLGETDDQLWRHVLQYGVAAWTGLMLGIASLRLVHVTVDRRFGIRAGWVVATASTLLCAIGVVIGRFQRWNSWDLVTRPTAVTASTLEWVRSPISDVRSTGLAIVVALVFGTAYVTVWAAGHLTPRTP